MVIVHALVRKNAVTMHTLPPVSVTVLVGVAVESSVILQIFPTRLTRVHHGLVSDSGGFQSHVVLGEMRVEVWNRGD